MKKGFLLIGLFLLFISLFALPVLACDEMGSHSEATSGSAAATGMAVSDSGNSMMSGTMMSGYMGGYMGGYNSLYLIGQVLYLVVLVLIVYLLVKLIKKAK